MPDEIIISNKEELIGKLEKLGFPNAEELFNSIISIRNTDLSDPFSDAVAKLIMDKGQEAPRYEISLLKEQLRSFWTIAEIEVSGVFVTNQALAKTEVISVKNQLPWDYDVLTKDSIDQALEGKVQLALARERLQMDKKLKAQLDAMGFLNHGPLIANATQMNKDLFLPAKKTFPNPKSAEEHEFSFKIHVGPVISKEPRSVEYVEISFIEPNSTLQQPSFPTSLAFYPGYTLPTAKGMMQDVLFIRMEKLLDYAKAFDVSAKMDRGLNTGGPSKRRKP